MIYVIYILIAAALLFIIRAFFSSEEVDTVSILKRERPLSKGAIFKLLAPLSALNFIILKMLSGLRKGLERKISFLHWNINSADFFSVKELIAAAGGAGVFFLMPQNMKFSIIAAGVGFILPDFILSSKVKSKKEEILRVLPETVDLLSLCIGAGLDFMAAVKWITVKAHPNLMIEELKLVIEDTKVGISRLEALRNMSKRLDSPEVGSFVRSLIQAEKMGTSVEEAFKIISDDIRMRRSFRGKKEAQKTALKMLIPLILFILPIILLIVAGPVLLQFMKGGIGTMLK